MRRPATHATQTRPKTQRTSKIEARSRNGSIAATTPSLEIDWMSYAGQWVALTMDLKHVVAGAKDLPALFRRLKKLKASSSDLVFQFVDDGSSDSEIGGLG